MSQFHFRLDRLLALREAAERQRAGTLGHAAHSAEACRASSAAREAELRAVQAQAVQHTGSTPVAAGLHLAYALTVQAAQVKDAAAAEALRAAEDAHADALAAFTASRVARRSLEKLRERAEEEFHVAEARTEQQRLDEIGSRRPGGMHP